MLLGGNVEANGILFPAWEMCKSSDDFYFAGLASTPIIVTACL